MFNGVRVSLEGKVASVRESQRQQQDSLQRRIARAERQVSDAEEYGRWDQVHQKKRRLANLRNQLVGLEADIAASRVRLYFGSRRLWRKRDHLEANGYGSHQDWLNDWRDARSDEFFVLGSRDETAGCQLCVAAVADDGTLSLRLRLPDCLANQHSKYRSSRACGLPTGTSRCWRRWGAMLITPHTVVSMVSRRPILLLDPHLVWNALRQLALEFHRAQVGQPRYGGGRSVILDPVQAGGGQESARADTVLLLEGRPFSI